MRVRVSIIVEADVTDEDITDLEGSLQEVAEEFFEEGGAMEVSEVSVEVERLGIDATPVRVTVRA